MINIQHTYCTKVNITYLCIHGAQIDLVEEQMRADMDSIAEHICAMLFHHNFTHACASDADTGEVVLIIDKA